MKIDNTKTTFINNQNQGNDKIILKKELFEEAKKLTNNKNKALIFDNSIVVLDMYVIQELHQTFKGDIKKYDNIFIATNRAKNYINKIIDFVLNDLNVAKADGNHDGFLTVAESLDAKRVVKDGEVLSLQEIKELEKNNEIFISVNEIINLHIKLDKNKDGKVKINEIEKDLKSKENVQKPKGNDSLLDKLYERLKKIEQQIKKLEGNSKDNEQSKELLSSLYSQKSLVMTMILNLLKGDS